MKWFRVSSTINKYRFLEIVFFIVFFFVFPIATDIEYNLKEQPCQGCDQTFLTLMIQRLVWGFFQIPAYLFLYVFIISRLLIRKKYFRFLLAFILFLFAFDLYTVYVEYWLVSKLSFLPEYITSSAAKWFQIKAFFHFSIIYVLQQTLVFTALAYFINYTKQEEKINALKQAKLKSDLNYLKAQIQPHFFFNTLNNIYSLAQQQSPATAPLVSKLAEMMRYIIYEAASTKVLVQREIEFLQNYTEIQSIRYNKQIDIDFDTQGINDSACIEPLLLLPFIENVFKHGVEEEASRGFVHIIIVLTGRELTLQTINSRPSCPAAGENPGGIGLHNVKQRLQLLYPGKHSLEIKDTARQFEVVLTIQLT